MVLETIKKAQTEGILEIKSLGIQQELQTQASPTEYKRQEERISDFEDTIEEINTLTKENVKSEKFLTQNIQETWDTVKRTNL